MRLEVEKLCLLVMIGVRADGRMELVGLADGFRGSTEFWADLLRDCRRRAMTAAVLAVGDGALGFCKACGRCSRIFESSAASGISRPIFLPHCRNRCTQGAVAAMKEIYNAEDIDKAQLAIKAFEIDYGAKYPKAVAQDRRRRRGVFGVLPVSRRALDPPIAPQIRSKVPLRQYV
ncbi:transposase [Mycobacterium intracellulare]|uniref:transposase n=1 Tax=Mycobacterium intracellulare TaxID=1767 RepID=UPI003AAA9404